MLWKRSVDIEQLNQMAVDGMAGHIGIRMTRLTDDTLEGVMPVDSRTRQPFGLLHGGASVTLAESLGSIAGYLCSQGEQRVVGVEINANHLRAVTEGEVRGVCRALHTGKRMQVWQIDIFDSRDRLCCTSRLTTAVVTPDT
ncbi:1,4-dihydroxy-2-naphthoyl-CoA hydrolase [Dickeya dianthicola]|uniref:1,4-dihydroxy-2-naphthoyl-CoA hydrolase n=1 Tax=Dickeya dianthicola TaxID=204039 RepID=A0AAP2D0T3_9GAMM|nr:hotdog fold thioesterase [Dickeya dianthicola]ATO33597.1 1,4-dihydroxy-2-naphthoyl-CoA hydrolase i menaquinone biosynthesis [Dickeya dianthicola RNS04.9]AYC19480.1 1,4-dihydroxy-2-naphthoyl-CoA hydrolase [Dickeya dianthicola]MBI0437596.1 hotdog fold thioesterase [Dickeya dianthicola]MBI0447858.1 hotdog fold thioesterase [Dickeya dianthicola]MBI0452475.1 hotdog fold thioesterase [Dickeya dianthicola]